MSKTHCLELSAPYACFTRPELKVERVSYDVITPSAARACFEAILWKPSIRWQVRRIEVLAPIRWINLRRNEVASVVSTRNVETAMRAGRGDLGLYIEDDRQQRAGLFLRDVAYRVHAELEFIRERDPSASAIKYHEMFERRARKGQCVNQPYLGCREFAAAFRLVEDTSGEPPAIAETRDLGFMLHDLDFSNPADPAPRFFRAHLDKGLVNIPAWDSEEVHG
ncbi:type I-C CRISPR-associated protein Cas5c [Xanthomonas translucens]|uniref:type I-C CRISPR-associated protein Cas5c n=1 Tax=Xanthomonas campestris pv. translucens TaxID=343 RepID=UPI00071E6AB8|nr:type I-C CRISPR-associated protein Cas5c [Xanthomonas translucens]QEO25187.1 type I-C CRISPR-associated protein Cas5 [Xanthomonas translucens pv. undulosa]UKE51278.1 type I-C CRISPR-associated protein Cas5 [Xanthomonas translucens]WLA09022.1 type I-C CRISPR-associated protein Cas5c [Xanthomonas translucens]